VVAGKSSYQGRGKGGDIVVDIEVVVLEGAAYRGGVVDMPMKAVALELWRDKTDGRRRASSIGRMWQWGCIIRMHCIYFVANSYINACTISGSIMILNTLLLS